MIQGKVALVTGGGSGLGKATAELITKQGGKVVILDLPSSNGAEVARELGETAIFTPADATSEEQVQKALDVTKETFGRLDFIVNCAGIGFYCTTYNFETKTPHDLGEFMRVLNTNVVGTFNVIRLAIGLMSENEPDEDGQRGVIVNVSSILGLEGSGQYIAYTASKACIAGLTLPWAREFGDYGIRVCAIAPTAFDTPIFGERIEEVKAYYRLLRVPFPKRFGRPSEFARLVLTIFENHMLNGEVIRLDGGVRLSGKEDWTSLRI